MRTHMCLRFLLGLFSKKSINLVYIQSTVLVEVVARCPNCLVCCASGLAVAGCGSVCVCWSPKDHTLHVLFGVLSSPCRLLRSDFVFLLVFRAQIGFSLTHWLNAFWRAADTCEPTSAVAFGSLISLSILHRFPALVVWICKPATTPYFFQIRNSGAPHTEATLCLQLQLLIAYGAPLAGSKETTILAIEVCQHSAKSVGDW